MQEYQHKKRMGAMVTALAALALAAGGAAEAKSPKPTSKKVTTAVACTSWGGAFALASLPSPLAPLAGLAGCATGITVNDHAWDLGEEIGGWSNTATSTSTRKQPPLRFDCRNFPRQAGCRR